MDKRQVTGVTVTVANPPDKGVTMEVRYSAGKPDEKKYASWEETTYNACLSAVRGDLDDFELRFLVDGEARSLLVDVPSNFMDGGRIRSTAMGLVERRLGRMGFDCGYVSSGTWLIHRPDPRGGYSNRGYFGAVDTIRLATDEAGVVDEAIENYWASHNQTSSYARYLKLGGKSMATKKADDAEKEAKQQVTVKAIDGTDVPVSPKQKEMYDEIKNRSASGSPVGSDEERLDDPSSIAAMKLATGDHPAVVRHKFGARWHYFAKQADLDKAVAAAEKAAEDAKKSSKKSAKSDSGDDEGGKAKGSKPAAGSGKALKKPSEK